MHAALAFQFSPLGLALTVAVVAGMEGFAWVMHRWVMHGLLWSWHASHHRQRGGVFETNDWFAVVFATPAITAMWVGTYVQPVWFPIGVGVTLYGMIYLFFHDGLVHRRFPFVKPPKSGYWKRLVQAHRIHHAVHTKAGCVSYGFLYAPPVRVLKAKLGAMQGTSPGPSQGTGA